MTASISVNSLGAATDILISVNLQCIPLKPIAYGTQEVRSLLSYILPVSC